MKEHPVAPEPRKTTPQIIERTFLDGFLDGLIFLLIIVVPVLGLIVVWMN